MRKVMRSFCFVVLILFIVVPAKASEVTFDDVKTYLNKTVQQHDPENLLINSKG